MLIICTLYIPATWKVRPEIGIVALAKHECWSCPGDSAINHPRRFFCPIGWVNTNQLLTSYICGFFQELLWNLASLTSTLSWEEHTSHGKQPPLDVHVLKRLGRLNFESCLKREKVPKSAKGNQSEGSWCIQLIPGFLLAHSALVVGS